MTKLNPVLSKPDCGWSTFCIDDFSFPVSYLRDTPQEIINALITNMGKNIVSSFILDSEGSECLVILYPYAGIYTIVNNSDNENLDNKIETRFFNINIKRFAAQFIKDIEKYADLWANWKSFGREELVKYYDLSELRNLIDA